MFAGEHFPGSTEAMGNFIENQQGAVFVTRGPDLFPIIHRWNEWRAPHSFADHGGDITFLLQHIINVVGAFKIAGGAAGEGAMPVVGRGHVLAAGQQGADAAAENGLAANGYGVQRRAVK